MVRQYVGKVEHFLVAGREVNVYLGIASLAATEFGVVTCMYTAENGYKYGFAGATPGILTALAMFFVGLTGFCIKPLRKAGVMTIPELFEKRFGPRIRWAAGVVIVLGGLLNMGVFLRITGEFLVLVCGFDLAPPGTQRGRHDDRAAAAGHDLHRGRRHALGAGHRLSPVHRDERRPDRRHDFDPGRKSAGTELAATVTAALRGRRIQSVHQLPRTGLAVRAVQRLVMPGRRVDLADDDLAALAAKDAKTGRQIYTRTSFFFACRFLIPGNLGHCRAGRADARRRAGTACRTTVPGEAAALYAMPLFLSRFVPVGLMGLLLAAMLAADMSSTSSYMITWAQRDLQRHPGPLPQDPLVGTARPALESDHRHPDRRLPAVLRPVVSVQRRRLGLSAVTGTIYLASMSTMLIACCYWKRANNWGAAAAIIVGAVIPIACLVFEQVRHIPEDELQLWRCYSGIGAFLATGAAMVLFSMLKPKFDPPQSATASEWPAMCS